MPSDYAIEKLTNAVECLVTHPGDVRQRLRDAFLLCSGLQSKNFSLELRADWEWIEKEMNKFGPLLDHQGDVWCGSTENTMKRIRRSTGVKIAKKIYELYWKVSANEPYA